MSPLTERSAPLSIHRAFVVQFHQQTDCGGGPISGRVAHIVSGRATPFQSLDALIAFIDQVLRDMRENAAQ